MKSKKGSSYIRRHRKQMKRKMRWRGRRGRRAMIFFNKNEKSQKNTYTCCCQFDSMREKFKMRKRNGAASFQSPSLFVAFSAVFLIPHLFLWTQFQARRRVVTQAEIWRFEAEKELESEKVEKQGQRYEGNKIRHRHILQDSSRVSWEKEKVSLTHKPD